MQRLKALIKKQSEHNEQKMRSAAMHDYEQWLIQSSKLTNG